MHQFLFLILFAIVLSGQARSQDLADAIKTHDLSKVKTLLSSGNDVNQKGNDGIPLIVRAVASGDTAIVNLLIDHGAKINVSGDSMMTPLMEAAARGYKSIAEVLIAKGAKIDDAVKVRTAPAEQRERTALMVAAEAGREDIVETLLHNNADVNFQATTFTTAATKNYKIKGETALMMAVRNQHCNITRLLLDKKADVNKHQEMINTMTSPLSGAQVGGWVSDDESALTIATKLHDSCSVQLLLDGGADPNITERNGMSPLGLASLNGDFEIADLLIRHKADVGFKAGSLMVPVLSYGIMGNNTNLVKLLLAHESDVNSLTNDNTSTVMFAVDMQNQDILNLLIDKKADVNTATNKGLTPLILAAKKGCTECVRILLAAGAKTDGQDNLSGTALTYAKNAGNQQIVDMLTKAGATK